MEITLEKIELVKDRTGVSYKEAKEALEAADGSVVDAIIQIEDSIDVKKKKSLGDKKDSLVNNVKSLVKKGNVSKIVIKDKDGNMLLNIPVNAGIVAVLVAPGGMLVAAVASFGFRCVVEVVKDDGTVVDVSDRVNEAAGKAVEKGSEFASTAKEKSSEVYEKIRQSETYDTVKDKAGETYDKAKEKSSEVYEKMKQKETYDTVKEKAGETYGKAKERAGETYGKAKEVAGETYDKAKSVAGETYGKAREKAGDIYGKAKEKAPDSAPEASEETASKENDVENQ